MESSFSRKLPEKCQIKTLYFFLQVITYATIFLHQNLLIG